MSDYRKKEHASLCCECRYACSNKCSWAHELTPVDGWTAVETRHGYDVYECPLFEVGRGLPRNIDTDGMILLLQALAQQTRDDYIRGVDRSVPGKDNKDTKMYRVMSMKERMKFNAKMRAANRRSIEKWLLGDGGRLLQISEHDAQEVIRSLKPLADEYEAEQARMVSKIE